MEVVGNLEVKCDTHFDKNTTDVVYQLIVKKDSPSLLTMIQFYGDIDRETAYCTILNVSTLLQRTYMVVGSGKGCIDPESLGAKSFWSIMKDRNSKDFYYLSVIWPTVIKAHLLLLGKDLLGLSFVVGGIDAIRPVPEVLLSKDMDSLYSKIVFGAGFDRETKGSQVYRWCGNVAKSFKDFGNWRIAMGVWSRFLRYLHSNFPEIPLVIGFDIIIHETTTGGHVTASDTHGVAFESRFNVHDNPWHVLARAMYGYSTLALGKGRAVVSKTLQLTGVNEITEGRDFVPLEFPSTSKK
jgi:hypothetical protein